MPFVRRNYPRISPTKPLTVIIHVDGKALHNPVAKNISMGGMCVVVEDHIKEQQAGSLEVRYECDNEVFGFKVDFSIPWAKSIDQETNTQEFGIKFSNINPQDMQSLGRILIDYMRINGDENVSTFPL